MGAPAPKRSSRDVKALIKGARRPERTVLVCLRADLQAEIGDLERQLAEIEDRGSSLAGNPQARALAERQQQVRDEMHEHTVTFRVRGLSRERWTRLVAEFPARKDNDADKALGVNLDDFAEAMLRECIVEPTLDEEDWSQLLTEALTDATYNLLVNACWGVNQRDVDIPFSRAASLILQNSAPG